MTNSQLEYRKREFFYDLKKGRQMDFAQQYSLHVVLKTIRKWMQIISSNSTDNNIYAFLFSNITMHLYKSQQSCSYRVNTQYNHRLYDNNVALRMLFETVVHVTEE